MKKSLFAVAFVAVAAANAATIGRVIVRQQWPWRTGIKVEFVLKDVTTPVDVVASCVADGVAVDAATLRRAMTGDLYGLATGGVKTLEIDPVAVFGAESREIKDLSINLSTVESPVDYDEVIYKIFCLTNNTCVDVTRRQILSGEYGAYETDYGRIGNGFNTTLENVLIWTGVTNDVAYKTTHLVMRKISAVGKEWTIGAPSTEKGTDYDDNKGRENQHVVRLTEDYFIGVFEMTQAQFARFYALQGGFTNEADSAIRPVEYIRYGDHLRGLNNWKPEDGSISANEWVFWPTNAYRHCLRYNRALGFMRSRLGVKFDLPTEAQWEFACRAGSTNALYSGKEMITTDNALRDANVDEIAWTKMSDYSDAPGGTAQTRPVGLKKPNAYGLYDMAGNVSEWCLDWFWGDISVFYDEDGGVMADIEHEDPLVDPVGRSQPSDTSNLRVKRGGNWDLPQRYARSAYRNAQNYNLPTTTTGLRVVCPAAANWK